MPPAVARHATPLRFTLRPVRPFRLDLTAWALRRRPNNAVDVWDGRTYRRVLFDGERPVRVTVLQHAGALDVTVDGRGADTRRLVTAALERLLGLRLDVRRFYRVAARDARLHRLARRFRGVKPPRFATVFEALVNGIACQQVSLNVGILLLSRLAAHCGASPFPGLCAFPRPEDLADLAPSALQRLGFSGQKSRTLVEAARAVVEGRLALDSFHALSDEDVLQRLLALRGVGRWTAEYVLLRGLGRLHVFPGDDVGARRAVERWRRLRAPLDAARTRRILGRWQPFAGMVYFHLLLTRLEQTGCLA